MFIDWLVLEYMDKSEDWEQQSNHCCTWKGVTWVFLVVYFQKDLTKHNSMFKAKIGSDMFKWS